MLFFSLTKLILLKDSIPLSYNGKLWYFDTHIPLYHQNHLHVFRKT